MSELDLAAEVRRLRAELKSTMDAYETSHESRMWAERVVRQQEDENAALLAKVESMRQSRQRTVGDLTARDLGRRVRIEFTEFTLDAMEYAGSLTGGPCLVMRSGERGWPNFDTPVEFLDDEPASGHQRPGERLPSPDQAAQVLGDPETGRMGYDHDCYPMSKCAICEPEQA